MTAVAEHAENTGLGVRRDSPHAKLICAGLRKVYGSFTALDGTDISMPPGEFLTLLGPSGSGKTTLLMIIAGLVQADGGRLMIDGRDALRLPSHARDIGMVFQSYALFPHMTVFENIAFPLRMRRWNDRAIRDAVAKALELVRLEHVAERYPRELSGGQQQRIALARCVVYRPSIILMDEPLGALDKKLRDHMQFEIKQLQRELNATVLYVTHDQDEAMAMSDRICLMNRGGIEQLGTPADLYFRPASRFAADFLGESNLFPARLAVRTPAPVVDVFGHRSMPPAPTGGLRADAPLTLMVRPEQIILQPAGAGEGLAGTVELSTMLGGIVRTVVRLDNGTAVIAKSLTGVGAPARRAGEAVRVDWAADAGILLDRDSVRDGGAP